MDHATAVFAGQRPRLFGLAYRMLGSAHDAEDVVQDAWLRWAGHGAGVDNPAAWLTTVVTRLCLNRLDSARARRETYVGPWLPEPILTTDPAAGPAATVEERESVSLALLTTLERLTPPERAVYVLREAFGHSHAEVAAVLDVTEAGSRQLHTRARRHLAAVPTVSTTPADVGPLLARFVAAARDGDLAGLEALLAADVTLWSDGGGKVTAARRPVHGREAVARFLVGILGPGRWQGTGAAAEVNGAPAVLAFLGGRLDGVMAVEGDGEVRAVRILRNPDKLAFLAGQVSRSEGLSGRPS
ncbi:RNA polymerase sigma factor SigJ [Actinomycetospora flava]|uniref:RNA polymerase sigma factor SigJ n=1 Tax=Actinomycetospora flava TaxID=3129232 RepID=A0ABU8MGJ2_9PSEU